MGAYNSWGEAGNSSGRVAVETLSLLNRFVGVRGEVCIVQPGLTLRALVKMLAARGLCLRSVPVLQDQTVGGAIGCGSHGSSVHHGTLSDAVEGLTVLLPGGDVRRLVRATTQPILIILYCYIFLVHIFPSATHYGLF